MKSKYWSFRLDTLLDWTDWVLGLEITFGQGFVRFGIGPVSFAIIKED